MAIRFECDNVVIPMKEINEKFPGGYEAMKKEIPLGILHWSDGILIRLGDDPAMSSWLKDPVGHGIIPFNFHQPLPEEWHGYPDDIPLGCTPDFMWTNLMPEEPEKLDDGWLLQGGYAYQSHFIWEKANRWLMKWNNPNCFLYHLNKGEIVSAW